MIQTQVSLEEYQMKFLEQCQFYGFQDPSEVISTEAEIFSYFLSPLSLWERGRG